jgi:hypothetical protein
MYDNVMYLPVCNVSSKTVPVVVYTKNCLYVTITGNLGKDPDRVPTSELGLQSVHIVQYGTYRTSASLSPLSK